MGDVIGIGALNLDLFYEVGDLESLGLKGGREEAGKVVFDELKDRLERFGRLVAKSAGGSAANTVFALQRLGFQTAFVGRVGEDPEGEEVLKGMEGVDLSRVKRLGKTGLCLVVLDHRRDRALVVKPNANDLFDFADVDMDFLQRFKFVHMSSFSADRALQAQLEVARRLPPPIKLSLDPGELYAKRGLEDIRGLVERSWIVFLTEDELQMMTGKELKEGVRELLSLGPQWVVVKKGKKGAMAFCQKEVLELEPKEEVEVVDNTGAGDVFNAGVLAGILKGRSMEECLRFGHYLASKSLKGYGRAKYPERGDLAYLLTVK